MWKTWLIMKTKKNKRDTNFEGFGNMEASYVSAMNGAP
jgi:hypothetical protein